MDLNMVIKEKREKNIELKNRFWLIKKHKALGLIKITDKSIIKDLRDWLLVLPSSFIIDVEWVDLEKLWNNIIATSKIEKSDFIWFDFLICDENIENINNYLEYWVTPIISNNSHISSILKEFDPIKNEGNSYLFSISDKWCIYYSLIRYLENYKFPFDNKNLVKNVLSI